MLVGVVAATGGVNFLSSVRADTPPLIAELWTWGLGTFGQLGPARANATVPSPMHAPGRWIAVSAGSAHTLALTDSGEVWAWGRNDLGQLGDGTTTGSMLPVQVVGLSGVTSISAGGFHSLAYRASDATLWAWGSNASGQLAQDSGTAVSPVAVEITGLGVLKGIAAGGGHSLVLRDDGTVLAWGSNQYGQLGTGDFSSHASPVPVVLPGVAVGVGAGSSHSLAALASGGAVYTWGWNVFGQLGRGYQGTPDGGEPLPAAAFGVKGAVDVTGGDLHSLARTNDGHVWAWGYNTEGQVGNGAVTPANTGVLTPVLLDIDSIASVDAGGIHSIAMKTNGEVWTWGSNQFGAAGDDRRADELRPVRALEIGPAVAVSAGGKHSVAVAAPAPQAHVVGVGATSGGTVPTSRPAVRTLAGPSGVSMLSSGARHVLAIDADHAVWAWGDNGAGQLGVPGAASDDPVRVPIPLDTARGFVSVAAGGEQSFALRSDGVVFAWGDNAHGELGLGTTSPVGGPTEIASLSNVVAIAAGERHALAQDRGGTVWGWGENENGQLGIAASAVVSAPVAIPAVISPQVLAAGGFHSLAVGGVGELLAWGAGFRGQLGRASLGDSAFPVSVTLPKGVTTVGAGRYHTVVSLAGGDVWGFGDNGACQLGVSPLVYPFTDAPVDMGMRNGLAVAAGSYHSLALGFGHDVVGCGDDTGAELGRDDATRAHYDCDAASVGVSRATTVVGGLATTTVTVEDAPFGADSGTRD